MVSFIHKLSKDMRIKIPSAIEELLKLKEGDIVKIDVVSVTEDNAEVITAAYHYRLRELVKKLEESGKDED